MLNVENLTLHYGHSQILHGVSLSARAGAVTCVMGTNGVGKTSLMRAISGAHPRSGGTVTLDGEALGVLPAHALAHKGVATVPQGREIFPLLTVRENLETGFAPVKRRDRSIPDYVFELFPVLKDMLNRRGGDLSGGQQQQLAIGRALVTRPRLLVLDEPTEGIQPSIIKDIGRAIRFLRDTQGIAVLLVEQYLEFCRELADDVYIMDRGEVVHAGDAPSLDRAEVRAHLTV